MASTELIDMGICSDTHGGALPGWADRSLNAVLHAGDAYHAPDRVENEDDPAQRLWVESVGAPVLAVRGNHDHLDPGGFFRAAEDVTGRLCRLAPGLWVAGVGFAPELYYDLPGESDLEPMCSGVRRPSARLRLCLGRPNHSDVAGNIPPHGASNSMSADPLCAQTQEPLHHEHPDSRFPRGDVAGRDHAGAGAGIGPQTL